MIKIVRGSKINQLEINIEINKVNVNRPTTLLKMNFFDFILEQLNISVD